MSSEKVEDKKPGFDPAGKVISLSTGEYGIHVSEKGGKMLPWRFRKCCQIIQKFHSLLFAADSAAILASLGFGIVIDPDEAEAVRKKIDRSVLSEHRGLISVNCQADNEEWVQASTTINDVLIRLAIYG